MAGNSEMAFPLSFDDIYADVPEAYSAIMLRIVSDDCVFFATKLLTKEFYELPCARGLFYIRIFLTDLTFRENVTRGQ